MKEAEQKKKQEEEDLKKQKQEEEEKAAKMKRMAELQEEMKRIQAEMGKR